MRKLTVLLPSGLLFFILVLGASAQAPALDPFPPEVESCLRAALGDERFGAISAGTDQPTPGEIARAQECMQSLSGDIYTSPPPPDAQPDPTMSMPQELIDCLKAAVGAERFNAISSGQSQPTPEEMSSGEHCFQIYSDTVPPPPSDSPPPETTGMPPELVACLKAAVGEERFNLISSGQAQPTPEEMSSGDHCFQGYTTPSQGDPVGAQPSEVAPPPMDPWLEACLRDAVGDERFDAISSGQAQPTDVEKQKGIACFARLGHERPTVVSASDHPVQTEVLQCLKLALGEERFRAIAEGTAHPTLADRERGEKCFGSTPAPISPSPHVVLDETATACLRAAVGEERFNAISSGESAPTPEERVRGEACFEVSQHPGDIAPDVILPLPADQVPYLPENTTAVSVDDVSQDDEIDSSAETSSGDSDVVLIEGTAPPGEIVDIYIHSDTSIVASTEADSSGSWSYTVLGLEQGPHLAYATAKVDGSDARSAPRMFEVGAGGAQPAEPLATPSEGVDWTFWSLLSATAVVVVIASGAGYRLARKRIKSQ